MRILIDECLDWRLCVAMTGHECASVQRMGWSGISNGALLARAEKEFDVFLTGDRNLTFQQELSWFDIAVVVLLSESTQLHHTLLLMPKVMALLPSLKPGGVVHVTA